MANTLRRKMFKLGGSANTHGVGITSGLKMKKGGTVPVGVGSGNQPKKMGPDGKMRDAHALQFLPLLGGLASRAVGLPAIRALIAAARQGTTQPLRQFVTKGDDILKMARTSGSGARVGGASGAYSPVASKIVGQTTPSGLTQAGRVAQLLTPLGGGAGLGAAGIMAGLDRAGVTTPGEDDTLLESGARGFGKFATDTSLPGLLTRGVGMLTGDEKTGTFAQTSLFDKLSGRKTKAPVVGSGDESETTKTIKKQEDEFAGIQDKAERMAAAIRKENNIGTLSQAALQFGQSASAGDDLATALATGSQPIFDELGRRRDLTENIGGMLAQQVLADEATQGAMIAEAAKSGDPAAVLRMQKYFDGYNEGVTNILPIDAKGNMDLQEMAPGRVYMDLEGATGSRYVSVNTKKDDGSGGIPKAFDSVEDANAYAQT